MTALLPFFRESIPREAYVLRVVGNWFGPVLRPRPRSSSPSLRRRQTH